VASAYRYHIEHLTGNVIKRLPTTTSSVQRDKRIKHIIQQHIALPEDLAPSCTTDVDLTSEDELSQLDGSDISLDQIQGLCNEELINHIKWNSFHFFSFNNSNEVTTMQHQLFKHGQRVIMHSEQAIMNGLSYQVLNRILNEQVIHIPNQYYRHAANCVWINITPSAVSIILTHWSGYHSQPWSTQLNIDDVFSQDDVLPIALAQIEHRFGYHHSVLAFLQSRRNHAHLCLIPAHQQHWQPRLPRHACPNTDYMSCVANHNYISSILSHFGLKSRISSEVALNSRISCGEAMPFMSYNCGMSSYGDVDQDSNVESNGTSRCDGFTSFSLN
jgi:hypothetical protein